jgi:ribosomal protein L37AE/L43A
VGGVPERVRERLRSKMKNNAKCKKCKKGFVMGWNGTIDGCDECTNTVRDSRGNAWSPGEKSHTYQDANTGEIWTVSRRKALNPK